MMRNLNYICTVMKKTATTERKIKSLVETKVFRAIAALSLNEAPGICSYMSNSK